jgi:hypothetical protein
MKTMIQVTSHANTRMAQRGIRMSELLFCLDVGETYHRTGAVFYVITDKCLSKTKAYSSALDIKKLQGLTAIIKNDNGVPYVATVYKNREAVRQIRKKCKTNLKNV